VPQERNKKGGRNRKKEYVQRKRRDRKNIKNKHKKKQIKISK